jgi:HPt (histidine-containing phosphotransfer) domain-containing protein
LAQAIDKETRQQDNYLDQIDQGLAALKDKAGRMNEELSRQERLTDKVHDGVSTVNERMRGVNKQGFKGI